MPGLRGSFSRDGGRWWEAVEALQIMLSHIHLSFSLWRMHSVSYVRGFPVRVFYMVMSFKEASEDLGYCCHFSSAACCTFAFHSYSLLLFRTRGSVRCMGRGPA